MFERLGSMAFRFRFVIVVLWIVLGVGAVKFAPSLANQGMTDQSAFLPAGTEAVLARDAINRAFPADASKSSATIAISREGGLTEADHAYLDGFASWLTSGAPPDALRNAVTGVDTATTKPELKAMLRSEDGELELALVNLNVSMAGAGAEAVVHELRAHVAELAGAAGGLEVHITGQAGISSDYLAAIKAGTESSTAITIILVVAMLILIYRAPLAALIPLITIGLAFVVSRGTLGLLAAAGWRVSSLLDTFLVVIVFGVGTDYAIFLISRYKEELRHGDWHVASRETVKRIGEVITASAGTVIVGLSAMAFGQFGMIQSTGPALAVAIFVTLVAGLTLTPALLAIFGHYLFWPLHEKPQPEGEPDGFFARLAGAVSKRPGTVTAVILVALILPIFALPGMKTNFNALAELPANADAKLGYDRVAEHLGKGTIVQSTGILDAGADADILAPANLARLRDLVARAKAVTGIDKVASLVTPDGNGVVPDGFMPSMQLSTIADTLAGKDGSTAGANADTATLLGDDVTDGLDAAADYVNGLAAAFPDAAPDIAFSHARRDLDTARDQIETVREQIVVSTQLHTLADSILLPAAGGASTDEMFDILAGYFDELETAFPELRGNADLATARGAVASLRAETTAAAALDLSDALGNLAERFDDRPDATLISTSLAKTDEAKARKREITATFDKLPADFTALAAVFAGRPDDLYIPTNLTGDDAKDVRSALDAFVSADRTTTRFYITTTDDPYTTDAFVTIRAVQAVLHDGVARFGAAATAHVGGPTAELADVQTTLDADFNRVGIITVLGIFLVLVLLLRSIIAPIYLVLTVLLSCASAIGLSSWIFEDLLGQPGVSSYLPLMVFVLLVALGSDYNIFLMSRVREESQTRSIHDGVRIASGHTGAVITSAGMILAGTFGSMATAPLAILFQVGVAVALGVIIDTLVVRSILVPAITSWIGDRAWWPSRPWNAGGRAPHVADFLPPPAPAGAVAGAPRARGLGWRLAVLGTVLAIPALFAGLFAWASADPADSLAKVSAAVVNEDRPASIAGDAASGAGETVSLGADLAARLTGGDDDATFTWVATDAAEARDGLAAGRYGAVLTVPAGFSAAIAAIAGNATGDLPRATLHLQTNDGSDALVAALAANVSDAIAASTARTATARAVDRILLGVSDAHLRLATGATEATGVASDASGVSTGAATVSASAEELVSGLTELADGVKDAGSGTKKLADGVTSLADGLDELSSGASSLASGAHDAASGAGQLTDGAAALSKGLDTLASNTGQLPKQTLRLSDGAAGISKGAASLASGAASLAKGLAQLRKGTTGYGDQAKALDSGVAGIVSGLDGLSQLAAADAGATAQLRQQANGYAGSVTTYTNGVAGLAANCEALGGGEPLCTQLRALAAGGPALAGGAAGIADGIGQVGGLTNQLSGGIDQTLAGATQLRAGTRTLAAGAPALESGIAGASSGATKLSSGAASLAAGAKKFAAGMATFAAAMPKLAAGTKQSAAGGRSLAAGVREMETGLASLAAGADKLRSGARDAAKGAGKLADGATEAVDGTAQLTDGLDQAVDGAKVVQTSADGVSSESSTLADRADGLSSRLDGDAAAVPSYATSTRASVAEVVAAPVALTSEATNAITTKADGLAPIFMAIALWVGALAIFLAVPALPWIRRRRWWTSAAAGFGVGAGFGLAQAILMALVLVLALGTQAARLPELIAFAILAAVTFAAVNQALLAVLGDRGRFVAIVLIALQVAAAGVFAPIETAPAFLAALHPVLPLSAAVDAFRALIAGGGGSVSMTVLVLVAWLTGSAAVTFLVARWRWGRPGRPGRTRRTDSPTVAAAA